ncbi:MAG: hypothetical protein H0X41_09160 [Chitinophagaceae bacterium]|nr:hypothetical protein [Chitinophagaceae bacterium]
MRLSLAVFLVLSLHCAAQDTSVYIDNKAVMLKEVVVRSNLNVPRFIKRVKDDTSFHKAFLNLRVLRYTSINDIRMLDKEKHSRATLLSKTRQETGHGCRWMHTIEENHTGDMYSSSHQLNYYTAQMYTGIFLAPDTVCGENNIVAYNSVNMEGKSGISRHKEQLKMLFFNPGKKIPGLPFIGNKIALFDDKVSSRYDFLIDMEEYKGELCYVFKITPVTGLPKSESDQIIINEMTTWFNPKNWDIMGRNYDLSYNAGVYDFDVHIEVEMAKYKNFLVPRVMRYNGNWDVVFKKRERGIFTATLFDFNN